MLERLEQIENRFNAIEREMTSPQVLSNPVMLHKLAQERSDLENLVVRYRQYRATTKQLDEAHLILDNENDEEMRTLAKQEIVSLEIS